MRRSAAIFAAGIMALSLAACGTSTGETTAPETVSGDVETETPDENGTGEVMVGAYQLADSPEVTDEDRDLLESATEGLTGAGYEAVAYIGSQVVAGTNHLMLCKLTTVTAEPVSTYALVTIYEDLQGNAELTEVRNSEADAESGEGLEGGWELTDTPVLTDEAVTALETADTDGVYTPVALLATQIVAGTNYCMLCQNADGDYEMVYVYADLQGGAEITDSIGFEAAYSEDAE